MTYVRICFSRRSFATRIGDTPIFALPSVIRMITLSRSRLEYHEPKFSPATSRASPIDVPASHGIVWSIVPTDTPSRRRLTIDISNESGETVKGFPAKITSPIRSDLFFSRNHTIVSFATVRRFGVISSASIERDISRTSCISIPFFTCSDRTSGATGPPRSRILAQRILHFRIVRRGTSHGFRVMYRMNSGCKPLWPTFHIRDSHTAKKGMKRSNIRNSGYSNVMNEEWSRMWNVSHW